MYVILDLKRNSLPLENGLGTPLLVCVIFNDNFNYFNYSLYEKLNTFIETNYS